MALGDLPYEQITSDISQIVADQGFQLTLYPSVFCPCGNTPDSPNNINCKACGGYGILYPTAPQTVTAMFSDLDRTFEMDQNGLGMLESGDITIYPTPGVEINNFDLVLLPNSIGFPTYSQMVERGSGTTDPADYFIASVSGAWTVDPTTGVSTSYTPNVDFTWSGQTITWKGNQPAQNQIYAIRYDARFEWVAYNPPNLRLAFGADLGRIVVLRKRHIVLPNYPSVIAG